MDKDVVILLEDERPVREALAAYYQVDMPEYLCVPCATVAQCAEALRTYGERVRCLISDEQLRGDTPRFASEMIGGLRRGLYGDAVKDIPIMMALDGDIPVLDLFPPVAFGNKGNNFAEDSTAFARTLAGGITLTPQDARNHNAQMLANILQGGDNQDVIRALYHLAHFDGNPLNGYDEQRYALMRTFFTRAFTSGQPDAQYLESLRGYLVNTQQHRTHIESETLYMQQGLLLGEMKTKVAAAMAQARGGR